MEDFELVLPLDYKWISVVRLEANIRQSSRAMQAEFDTADAHSLDHFKKRFPSVSSSFFGVALVVASVVAFCIVVISLRMEVLSLSFGIFISSAVLIGVVGLRKRLKLDWLKFSSDAILIRGVHGFFRIPRSEIVSACLDRSRVDEESVFTKAYILSIILKPGSKLYQDLTDLGFEVRREESGETLRFRMSGIQPEKEKVDLMIRDWSSGEATGLDENDLRASESPRNLLLDP